MKFTTKGRITLLRDGVPISTHVLAEEAYERAFAHASANGPGKYTVRYPDREVDLSTLTRVVLEAAPAGLQAQAISASAINLTWTANPRATGYRVYRNGTLIGSPTAASFSDTGLAASTAYTYTVSTVAATGEGPQGAAVQGTTLAAPDTTAPTAPVITATPTGQSTVSVALTTPATDSQSGVASYDLEYKTAAAATYTAITGLAANQFPYVIGSLSPATTYNNRARARDGVGNIGPYSAISNATTQAAQSGADPYPLYTAFDRALMPWHTASSPAWGPQVPFQAAALPNITGTTVTVTTAAQFNANRVPGRRIIIDGSWTDTVSLDFGMNDIDIVVNPGRSIGAILIGQFFGSGSTQRIRIRGPVPGTYSGGVIGQVRTNGPVTDLVIDGVGMNGRSNFGNAAEDNIGFYPSSQTDRVAIMNSLMHVGGYGIFGAAAHFLIANTNIMAGAVPESVSGRAEAAAFRANRGPIAIIDSALGSSRYHILRPYTANGPNELFYCGRSQIRALSETKVAWLWNKLGEPAWGWGWGAILEDCNIYAYNAPSCPQPSEISSAWCTYTRVRRNNFFNGGNATYSQASLDSEQASSTARAAADSLLAAAGRGWDINFGSGTNTFASLTSTPAWPGLGNPNQVTLPNGWTPNYSSASCPIYTG